MPNLPLKPPNMARKLVVTEAVTGRALPVLNDDIYKIVPCVGAGLEYGFFPGPYRRGSPDAALVWTIFSGSKCDMAQISWKDGRDDTFVLHPWGELNSGFSKLHMNPLLIGRFTAQLDFIEGLQTIRNSPHIVHVPRFFGLEFALPFKEPDFMTFPASTSQIRNGLRCRIPLGNFEYVSPPEPTIAVAVKDAAPASSLWPLPEPRQNLTLHP